jgi:hypothetical protein
VKPRMLVLLVDALGWELARSQPGFAAALPHRRRIETVLGFSSGALPTLFTGRPPCEHGRWLMYRRAAGATPFAGFGWLRGLPGRVQRSHRLGLLLSRVVARRGVRGYFHLYEVPRWLLPEFDLAEREDIFAPGGLPVESLWDSLERRRLPWCGWNWRSSEEEVLAAAGQRVAEGRERFLFCYTAELDALLHHQGSTGAGVRARLARYAEFLAHLPQRAARRGDELWIYLLSDHGMVDVRARLDVMARLRGLSAQWPRDYLAFFDSTMARFWWRAAGARDEVRAALATVRGGRWLEDAELERAGALFPGRDYGEDVFLLDPGVLMLPSFMGSLGLAAMHGYDPAHPDMAALLWSNRPIPEAVARLGDVRGFLEAELDALEAA